MNSARIATTTILRNYAIGAATATKRNIWLSYEQVELGVTTSHDKGNEVYLITIWLKETVQHPQARHTSMLVDVPAHIQMEDLTKLIIREAKAKVESLEASKELDELLATAK